MKTVEIDSVEKKVEMLGVTCPKCGGDLITISLADARTKLIKAATLGLVSVKTLECAACKKKYKLI
jgi:uncharacterized protein with PIN domain